LVHTWLSLPLPALILVLAVFYSLSGAILVRISFWATAGYWLQSFRGVVAPFVAAVVAIFGILIGFLASDIWDRNRRAAVAVRTEAASLVSLHALSSALGSPHFAIDRAIRAYTAAVLNKEWPRMQDGEASAEAEEAQDNLLRVVAQSDFTAGHEGLGRLLLESALKVREARNDRLAFSSDFGEGPKWACVLLMALLGQISVATVHLNEARAQAAAMVIFTTSIILVIGLLASHEAPFQPPLGVSPDPIARILDLVPDA
jgi:hypothetical protein